MRAPSRWSCTQQSLPSLLFSWGSMATLQRCQYLLAFPRQQSPLCPGPQDCLPAGGQLFSPRCCQHRARRLPKPTSPPTPVCTRMHTWARVCPHTCIHTSRHTLALSPTPKLAALSPWCSPAPLGPAGAAIIQPLRLAPSPPPPPPQGLHLGSWSKQGSDTCGSASPFIDKEREGPASEGGDCSPECLECAQSEAGILVLCKRVATCHPFSCFLGTPQGSQHDSSLPGLCPPVQHPRAPATLDSEAVQASSCVYEWCQFQGLGVWKGLSGSAGPTYSF